MADLMTALRNAHNAGDTQAATRIAAMIKSQQHPQQDVAPTGAATTSQDDSYSVGDTLAGMSRIGAGAVADVANIGVGAVNAVQSAGAWAGEKLGLGDGTFTPMAPAGYGDSDISKEYLTPQTTGEKIVASLPSYMVGGEIAAPVKAAEGAGRLVRAGTAILNNAPSAITGELAEDNQGDLSATNIAVNSALPPVIEKVGGAAVKGVRSVLPEGYGGFSTAQKAAEVVNPEYLSKVTQGDNQAAQEAFRTSTTDAAGNSTILPSQAFNSQAGNKYIAAESRDMLRGENSVFNQRLAQQQNGESLETAVNNANQAPNVSLQDSAQEITGQFKQQANKLYNESKQNAQDILDSRNVVDMHMSHTKNLADTHLVDDAKAGKINLNAETRRTLTQLQKTKFDSISTLDNWKRALSEKASKAYRSGDYNSSTALKEVLNSLRGEADATINSIDPAAGSIYRDADSYFSQSVGDFGSGKKSVLGKIADKENPATAANILVRGQNAEFHANQIGDALQGALATGSLDDAARLSTQFGKTLGATTRQTALDAANTGANFSPTKFANTLNRLDPQAGVASQFSADEQAVNNALADAVGLTRNKAKNASRVTNVLASKIGEGAGKLTGAALGTLTGSPFMGSMAGYQIGGALSKAVGEGLLDRIVGTNARGIKYIDYLSDPANAKQVADILADQGGLNAPVEAIKRTVNALTGSTVSNSTITHPATSTAPVVAPIAPSEPEQHAQMARKPEQASNDQFDHKTTRLYKALAHAETGNLSNRFIRTKAAESGVSTAYGPAQLTVSTMSDFYKRNPSLFNARERDYISRFIDQGEHMKHADKNDPVFGYGGTGVLGGKEDRKLYASVTRKMLQKMIKDNNGSLDKTVLQWRGNNNDHAYFAKVRTAFHSS